jgi:hypothetical protein
MVQWAKLFGLDGQTPLDRHRIAEEARRCMRHHLTSLSALLTEHVVLPTYHEETIPSAIDPVEVTKVALRLKYLIEACIPCELEEELITKPHSRIITEKVLKAAKEAGGDEFGACVVYCLLVNKRWFHRQAKLEIWDADLHNVRAVAAEMIAKRL